MRQAFIINIATLISALAVSAPKPPAPMVIPIEFSNGLPIAKLKVNDQPLRLVIDSGAFDELALTEFAAGQLRLKHQGKYINLRTSGQDMAVLDYGSAQLGLPGGTVFQVKTRSLPFSRQGYDGTLGAGFLGRFILAVNYGAKSVSLIDRADEDGYLSACRGHAWSLEVVNGLPIATVRLGEHVEKFGVDTGSNLNLVSEQLFNKVGENQFTFKESDRLHHHRDVYVDNIKVQAGGMLKMDPGARGVTGFLGGGFFFQNKACLDLVGKKSTFQPN